MTKNRSLIALCQTGWARGKGPATIALTSEGELLGAVEFHPAAVGPQPGTEFLELASKMDVEDLTQACHVQGLPYLLFGFRGTYRGRTDGISYPGPAVGNSGQGSFYRTKHLFGEVLEYQGAQWVVLCNNFDWNQNVPFALHKLLIVPPKEVIQ
jgi:hypothetical protein